MDHMSNQLNKIVGTACLSMMLQFGANAQNATSPVSRPRFVQDNVANSSNSSSDSSSNTDLNKLALKANGDDKSDASNEPAIVSPKINPKNPALNLKVTARESKTDARAFAAPNLDEMGEPQSFHATAYALKGRTRMGTDVRRGVIAADPRVLPLGSVVQLRAGKYSGVYTVHDTGKRIKGNVIDLWVPDRKEARQFGRRQIKLHVLRLGSKGRTKK
jgi:3D (Asp-Asp-Asp) domain-containing protein